MRNAIIEDKACGGFKSQPDVPTLIPQAFDGNLIDAEIDGALLVTGFVEYTDVSKQKYREPFSFHPTGERMPLAEYEMPSNLAWFPLASFLNPEIKWDEQG